jgi:hypothetical protein
MSERIERILDKVKRQPGASEVDIQQLLDYAACELPAEYLDFLRWSNGVEGTVGEDHNSYLALFSTRHVAENDEGYGLPEFTPGFLLIGSDMGGDGFAFDVEGKFGPPMGIVRLDLASMSLDHFRYLAPTFYDFLVVLSTADP